MGLTIYAYQHVTPMDKTEMDELGEDYMIDAADIIYISQKAYDEQEKTFPGRFNPLQCGAYRVSGEELDADITYGSYATFRALLEGYADYVGEQDLFELLINFYDCDGIIGSEAAATIDEEMREHRKGFISWSCEQTDSDYAHKHTAVIFYDAAEAVFALAAEDGAVLFV